jgi:hypothetical protein
VHGTSTADPVLVESLMPNGPAEASGLIVDGDELLAVGDVDVKFKSLEEVHRMIWYLCACRKRHALQRKDYRREVGGLGASWIDCKLARIRKSCMLILSAPCAKQDLVV